MENRKSKRKKKKDQGINIMVVMGVLIGSLFLPSSNSLASILLHAAICIGLIAYVIICSKKDSWIAKILASLPIALFLLDVLIPNRLFALSNVALFVAITAYFIFRLAQKKVEHLMLFLGLELFLLFLTALIQMGYFSYLDAFFAPYSLIGIILAVILGVVATLKFTDKNDGRLGRFGIFITAVLLVFFCFCFLTSHLNYGLDFSRPQQYIKVIEDKDFDYNRKGPDSYEFKVTVNGDSFYLDVPRSAYKHYNVGDTIYIYLHKGALGEPFYSYYP